MGHKSSVHNTTASRNSTRLHLTSPALTLPPSGVLLELIQNADDAGASQMSFLLDTSTYPSDSVLSPAMAMWQVGVWSVQVVVGWGAGGLDVASS